MELAGLPTVPSCNGMDPEPSTHCLHGQSYASAFGVGSAPKRDFAIMQWPCELTPSQNVLTSLPNPSMCSQTETTRARSRRRRRRRWSAGGRWPTRCGIAAGAVRISPLAIWLRDSYGR
eukprot:COSAG04_NODE_1934_length_5182_cov_25.084349_5_plen_119_part_00